MTVAETTAGASIRVDGLAKSYRGPSGEPFAAVDGISFRAGPGRIFGLLGPNGAGKTTTLRILSTLIPPTAGTARVGGFDVVGDPAEVRRRIGFLTGSTGLYPRLTAREAVRYFGRLYGVPAGDLETRIGLLFDRLEITPFQDKRCGDLSTGMKQKVSIARAIVHDPPVLILDEPTTGLDVLASRHLVDFILASRSEGKCVLFSTHVMSEAERLCDEIAILHRGRITASGTVEELRRRTGKTLVEDVFLALLGDGAPGPRGGGGMNRAEIGIVWRKEVLDTLRDRRTIMAMIVLPLLIYPVLIVAISQLGLHQVEKMRQSRARVALVPPDAVPALAESLAADTTFALRRPADPESALAARDLDAVIRVPLDLEARLDELRPAEITVLVDLSRDRGGEMRDRVESFLDRWRSGLVDGRLRSRDLPGAFARPFTVEIDNVAGARKMGGSLLGRILPFFLVVMMMTGAFYPAIDVTAGERERGTLETLLVVPAGRFNLVLGKFLTVFLASVVTTLANLASLAFTLFFLIGSANLGGSMASGIASLVDWRAFLLIFVIMIPMALFFSALAMLVASFARSFKEAQNYLSPLVIACMAPAYLAFLPGIEINTTLALVPVANVVLLSRELFLGNIVWSYIVLTLATMTALALLLLLRTVTLFGGEGMLGGVEGAPKFRWGNLFRREAGRRSEPLGPGLVAPVFLLVLLGFFYLGTPLQLRDVKSGLVATQILVIAGIPLLALRFSGIPVVRTLRLGRPPRPAALLLALVAAPAATMIAALVGMAQGLFLEVPASYRELMEKLFQAQSGGGLLVAVIVFAVIPGICEEILFRGFVLRGLLRRLTPGRAILWTAVLFGAFHFDLYRLFPTMALGAVLGWTAWITGSLWPAILLHAANNTLAVLATNSAVLERLPWLGEGARIPPVVLAVAAVLGIAAAYGLFRLRAPGPPPEAPSGPSGASAPPGAPAPPGTD